MVSQEKPTNTETCCASNYPQDLTMPCMLSCPWGTEGNHKQNSKQKALHELVPEWLKEHNEIKII